MAIDVSPLSYPRSASMLVDPLTNGKRVSVTDVSSDGDVMKRSFPISALFAEKVGLVIEYSHAAAANSTFSPPPRPAFDPDGAAHVPKKQSWAFQKTPLATAAETAPPPEGSASTTQDSKRHPLSVTSWADPLPPFVSTPPPHPLDRVREVKLVLAMLIVFPSEERKAGPEETAVEKNESCRAADAPPETETNAFAGGGGGGEEEETPTLLTMHPSIRREDELPESVTNGHSANETGDGG